MTFTVPIRLQRLFRRCGMAGAWVPGNALHALHQGEGKG
jgi:hypothetical protein